MRKAAGILMIICSVIWLSCYVPMSLVFTNLVLPNVELIFHKLLIALLYISAAFIFPGGVFCLERKYWKLCFAAALLAVIMMVYWIYGATGGFGSPIPAFSVWWFWSPIITGVLPMIFICMRKREWQEISDSVDGGVSYAG